MTQSYISSFTILFIFFTAAKIKSSYVVRCLPWIHVSLYSSDEYSISSSYCRVWICRSEPWLLSVPVIMREKMNNTPSSMTSELLRPSFLAPGHLVETEWLQITLNIQAGSTRTWVISAEMCGREHLTATTNKFKPCVTICQRDTNIISKADILIGKHLIYLISLFLPFLRRIIIIILPHYHQKQL